MWVYNIADYFFQVKKNSSGYTLSCVKHPYDLGTFNCAEEAAAAVFVKDTGCPAWDAQEVVDAPPDLRGWVRMKGSSVELPGPQGPCRLHPEQPANGCCRRR